MSAPEANQAEGPGSSSTCRVCHRALSNPRAIQIGVGPVCARKTGIPLFPLERGEKHLGQELGPFHGDVVCCFLNGEPATNIAHLWHLHSPTGFAWAYGGSGPADLALNILLNFTTRDEAEFLHQDFKRAFIQTLPKEGGVIKRATITAWLQAQRKEEK